MTLAALLLAAALGRDPALSEPAPDPGLARPDVAGEQAAAAPAATPAQAFIDAGLRAFKKRRFAAALAEFKKATEADPQSAAAAYYLGYTYYKIAEPRRRNTAGKRKAAELFARAFELDPAFQPTWAPGAGPPSVPSPTDYRSPDTRASGRLSEETVERHASARLGAQRAQLILDNDAAFSSKLALVTGATATIDAQYYIWSDDFSSSVLAEALIEAAKRGVHVRLLVDYHTNYSRLDLFSMLERRARGGSGSLEVRLYNRPTRNIVRDAVYLTLGCGTVEQRGSDPGCAPVRLAEVERRFEEERIDGRPARDLGISNLNLARSGLFLSGWYAKRPDLMALAMVQPPASALDAAPTPPVTGDEARLARAERRIQITTSLSFLGSVLDPVEQVVKAYRPARIAEAAEAARDWEYITDYQHHKLLLVDGMRLQLGGRNVEDSYHMQPNPLVRKYVFMDTDLRVDLTAGGEGVRRAFDRLWGFRTMVATLDEARLHAPNEVTANGEALTAARKACAGRSDAAARARCVGEEYARGALDQAAREQRRFDEMRGNAERYRKEYVPRSTEPQGWDVDGGAGLFYVENIPFAGGSGEESTSRSYGARNGQEAYSGKRIHGLWLASLKDACQTASQAAPKQVFLHNAYFFPPSNLTQALGHMVDGDLDCRHVTVTVLTNSIETTDLNVVNLLAGHVLKAFAEHAQAHRNPRAARIRFFEYKKPAAGPVLSLHSKVSVFGNDLMVGSANTDVRSYMMDSNNALFVRGAPTLQGAYLRHFSAIMADRARTRDLTDYFASVSRERIKAEDQVLFRELLAKYGAEKYLTPVQQSAAEAAFLGLLDKVYALTKASLAGGPDADARAEEFNRLFKPI